MAINHIIVGILSFKYVLRQEKMFSEKNDKIQTKDLFSSRI